MPRLTPDPTLVVLHRRIEALTKRVEKLDREVFKAIRIDADNTMPDMQEELQQQQKEISQIVYGMVNNPLNALAHTVHKLADKAGVDE